MRCRRRRWSRGASARHEVLQSDMLALKRQPDDKHQDGRAVRSRPAGPVASKLLSTTPGAGPIWPISWPCLAVSAFSHACSRAIFPVSTACAASALRFAASIRDEGELLSIGVGPSYRRRQIGAVLLRECMERCQRVGANVDVPGGGGGQSFRAKPLSLGSVLSRSASREGYYQRPDGSRMSAYHHALRSCERLPDLPSEPDIPAGLSLRTSDYCRGWQYCRSLGFCDGSNR